MTAPPVRSYTMGSNGTGYTHASVLVGSPAGGNQDNGTCTIPSTTTVTVTSSNPQTSWPADFWDQSPTGRHGWVFLIDPVATGVTQCFSAPIVANTALVAGGTSTLTLGLPMPINTYSTYSIYGQTGGASVVWCLYEVTNHVIGALMANQFQACVPYVSASGDAATLTSIPIGSVLWSASGAPPYTETPIAFTVQPTATPPTILFAQPTYLVAGSHVPIEVRALLAINAGVNQTFKPSSSTYEGTSHTVEGLTRRLVVTVTEWRDPLNTTGMAAYAQDILDSVKDAVMEGTVVYYGLFTTALTPGISINIAGDDGAGPYPTGWEASPGGGASNVSSFTPKGIPCVAVELEFLTDGSPLLYRTNLRLSNRRGHFGAGAYLRPPRTGIDVTTGLEGLEGVLLGANFGAAAIPNIATPSIDLPSLAAPSIANPSIQTPTLGGLLGGAMSPINVTPEMVDQGEFDLAQHLSSMGVPDALLGINPGGGAVAGAQGQNVPVADMANMVQAAMGGVPPDAAIRGVPQIQAEKELGAE